MSRSYGRSSGDRRERYDPRGGFNPDDNDQLYHPRDYRRGGGGGAYDGHHGEGYGDSDGHESYRARYASEGDRRGGNDGVYGDSYYGGENYGDRSQSESGQRGGDRHGVYGGRDDREYGGSNRGSRRGGDVYRGRDNREYGGGRRHHYEREGGRDNRDYGGSDHRNNFEREGGRRGGDRGGYGGYDGRGYEDDGDRNYGARYWRGGDRGGERFSGRRGAYDSADRGSDARGGGRGGGHGRGRGREEISPGVGVVTESGYERIGRHLQDPRHVAVWTGAAGVREVDGEDPELLQEFVICRRPGVARGGRSIPVEVNCFEVVLDSAPLEIYKYHVHVERSPPQVQSQTPPQEPQQEPALRRDLVRSVINVVLQQYKTELGNIQVVHDGMSALYAPSKLPWNTKTFADVSPDDSTRTHAPPDQAPRRGFRPRSFVVKMEFVEAVESKLLTDYLTTPSVNAMPVLQALDVVARHLAAQRAVSVGRCFFSLKNPTPLSGGRELCWGYHQAIRIEDGKLVMNLDQATTVFYAPTQLMTIALAALNVRSADDIRDFAQCNLKLLARALSRIEVAPTHRSDRPRPISGVSSQSADQTTMNTKEGDISIADYFSKRYGELTYPLLPLVNVGSKQPGKQVWLPIENCEVAPGQRCRHLNNADTSEIIRKTCQLPRARRQTILDHVRDAQFDKDAFLAAFGMKVDRRMQTTSARVMDPPIVQYANESVRPSGGQWNLRNKRFVEGGTFRSWGVVVNANVGVRAVQGFIRSLVEMARKQGMTVTDTRPPIIHQDDHRGAAVGELMKMCVQELETRNLGPPQLLIVIKQDKETSSYGEIKHASDTVLGVPSQCIVASNVYKAKPDYLANVCLKLNMKLGGKNSILRDPLPLVSTAPTIIIGADVEHPRSGMGSQPSIVAVVGSVDKFSAKYVARVGTQKSFSDEIILPGMLRDLFLAFYKSTQRRPEHVVYYRDGVGEGDLHDTLQAEMRALRKACKMVASDYNPPVTFIVVNKRHHMRFFPVNQRDGDRSGNMRPGTVIDTGMVDSHRFDFYLFGHSGGKGTSVPCHYTVLHDENKMSAEDVQRLTYHLGFTCSRCTRSLSFVTPVHYAHLVARRAPDFLSEVEADIASTSSTGSLLDTPGVAFSAVHNNLKDTMFFV